MTHAQVVPDLVRHHVDRGKAGAWVGLLVPVPHPHLPDHTPVGLGADPRHRGETHREVRLLARAVGSPEVDPGDQEADVPVARLALVRPQVALELAERGEEGSSVPSMVLEHTSSLVDLHVGDGELHLGAQGVENLVRPVLAPFSFGGVNCLV